MAACNDLWNHLPPHTIPPGIPAHGGTCSPTSSPCKFQHHGHPNGFQVCQTCSLHTQLILGLVIPQSHAGVQVLPANYPTTWQRLPEWFNAGLAHNLALASQWAVSPFVQNQGAIITNTRSWQLVAEYASGVLKAPPRFNPPFKKFLTRVCNDCEEYIGNEIHFRITGAIPTTNEERATCQQLPWNTCTCKTTLGMRRTPFLSAGVPQNLEVMCRTHRQATYDQLVATRDRNDRWLRNIALKKGCLVQASPPTLKARVNDPGYWRGCRVG